MIREQPSRHRLLKGRGSSFCRSHCYPLLDDSAINSRKVFCTPRLGGFHRFLFESKPRRTGCYFYTRIAPLPTKVSPEKWQRETTTIKYIVHVTSKYTVGGATKHILSIYIKCRCMTSTRALPDPHLSPTQKKTYFDEHAKMLSFGRRRNELSGQHTVVERSGLVASPVMLARFSFSTLLSVL